MHRTVAEVIEQLKTLPQDYKIFYDHIYGDFFECINVNDEDKEIYIY